MFEIGWRLCFQIEIQFPFFELLFWVMITCSICSVYVDGKL